MKKHSYIYATVLGFTLAVSCAELPYEDAFDASDVSDGVASDSPRVELVFSADLETTKTSLGSDWSVSWCEGDLVKILWDGGWTDTAAERQDGKVLFKASVEEAAGYYAIYPASVPAQVDETGKLVLELPQSFSGEFGDCAVIVAYTTRESLDFGRFRSAVSMVRFSINDDIFTRVVFNSANNAGISGRIKLDKELSVVETHPEAATAEIVVSGKGTYFFSMLPALSLPGFKFKLGTSQAWTSFVIGASPVALAAGDILCINDPLDNRAQTIGDWFITPTGAGLKDGSSWDDAGDGALLISLLSNLASSGLDGHTINVGEGSFDLGSGASFLDLQSGSPVTVNISGVKGKTVFTSSGTSGILAVHDADVSLNLKNLAFRDASNKGKGGALCLTAGSHRFAGCTFADNAVTSTTADDTGGAMYVGGTASVHIEDCDFIANKIAVTGGGALAFYSTEMSTILNCRFNGNNPDKIGNGGAILQKKSGSTLYVANCSFDGNGCATNGADIFTSAGNALLLYNCTSRGQKNTDSANLGSVRANCPVLVANSSLYTGSAGAMHGVLCFGANNTAAAEKNVIVNSIFLCDAADGPAFGTGSSNATTTRTISSYGHNLYSTPLRVTVTDNGGATDKASVKAADVWPSTELSPEGQLVWEGPDESFTKATPSEVEIALNAFAYGGKAFCAWLKDKDVFGKDAAGNDRGTAWWPGAYQKQ